MYSISSDDDDVDFSRSYSGHHDEDFPRFRTLKEELHLRQVDILWVKASFLRVVLSFGGEHNLNIEGGHLQHLLVHIGSVFQNVHQDLGRHLEDLDDFSSGKASSILQRLELLNPDIQQIYDILSGSSRFITGISTHEAVMENLNSLLHYVADLLRCNAELVAPVKEEIEAAQKGLRFLRNFLGFTAKRRSKLKGAGKGSKLDKLNRDEGLYESTRDRFDWLGGTQSEEWKGVQCDQNLIIHADFLIGNMSCLLYLCCVTDKMNDQEANELKMHLSSHLESFVPAQPDIREIYIKTLNASKSEQANSATVDEFGLGFLDSLREILELSDAKLPFLASNKDQILSLHEDLRILTICFAMYKSSDAQSDQFLRIEAGIPKHIGALIIDMGCLICLLHNTERSTEEADELKIAISDLQEIVKIVKEDARKAYDMYIPKSWQPKTKFRMPNNAKGVIRFLRKALKTVRRSSDLMTVRKSSNSRVRRRFTFKIPPRHLSEVQAEMKSLIRAFRELTAKQHVEYKDLEIRMTSLNDVRNQIYNFISSFPQKSSASWSYNLWLFILIEEIKMIKMEFKDLQNKILHDTSARKLPRKIYAEGKKRGYAFPGSFEDEAEKLGEQLINGSTKPHIFSIEDQLKWLETNLDLICPLKDEVNSLRSTAGFLKVFLSCKGKWHIEDGKLKVLFTRIHIVFQKADKDLQRLWSDVNIQISSRKGWCLPMNMGSLLSSVLSRLHLLNTDIQEVYTILSKSSRSITSMSAEAVMENINSLQENIEVLLKYNTKLVAPLKEELKAVQKSLRFLRNFIGFTTKRCSKLRKLKDLIILAESVAEKISCLLYLCSVSDKMNDQMVKEMKMHLSFELQMFSSAQPDAKEIYTKSLQASKSAKENSVLVDEFDLGFLDSLQDNTLELSKANLSFSASNIDQILSLLAELKLLITFVAVEKSSEQHSEPDQMSNYLFERINAVIIDIGCVICSLNYGEKNQKMARELELNKKISDFEAIISVTKDDTRKMYDLYVPKSLRSNFPRTNGQGFIDSLFQNLEELLNSKADLVAPIEHHIKIVQKELRSLREDFSKIAKQPSECGEIRRQWTCFLDIAYHTEYIIDSFLAGDHPLNHHKLGLYNVIEDIKTIEIDLKAAKNKMKDDTSEHKHSCYSAQISEESTFPEENNTGLSSKERLADEKIMSKLVIFKEESEKIREKLTTGSQKLHIISIVGMPGIGKTTLANSVMKHSSVSYHFHIQARCTVSQAPDRRRLLCEILQQVTAESGQYDDDGDLEKRLYQSLKGRRYLILMDDVWNIRSWDDMRSLFPDDVNGSRIIVTSRSENIATQAGLGITRYCLSPLSDETCWGMLKLKLFGNRSCPPELSTIGPEIAANCKGLPLTVDLTAGVLRVKERKEWKQVSENLMAFLVEDPEGHCRKVLELSYQNLPNDMKPCFLYFAAFPEDANVPTRDLVLLWIAEEGELRSIEDVAEDILNNLISRSLVMVSRRRPLGGVDASRVHDLLHEFVVSKAHEESFMLKIDGKLAKFSTLSCVSVTDQWQEQYRLCIYPDSWVQFLESRPAGPRTRALISYYAPSGSAFSLNLGAFKLLRMLYIPKLQCHYGTQIFTLIHLRVLSIGTFERQDAFLILSNIHKLQNLESFIMDRALSWRQPHEYLLLDNICNMVKLRHFFFGGYISFQYCCEKIWKMSSLFDNLRTLYHLRASYEEDIEKILKLMPNLVELKVLFYNPDKESYPFPRLYFLKKLESLEMKHHGRVLYNCRSINININFLPCLKKLVLSDFKMPWTEISELGNLGNLEILNLENRAFTGPVWHMVDGQFPQLKCLSLCSPDIEEWIAAEDHLQQLEQLYVRHCTNLKELPSCLEENATLKLIRLFNCSLSVEESAKRIKQVQEELGNEQLMIQIY